MSRRISPRNRAEPCLRYETTLEVRDHCLCLFVQRAARALARRFDEALRHLRLTHGQFSLLMSLNRPHPPGMGQEAARGLLSIRTYEIPDLRRGCAHAPIRLHRRGHP